MSKKENVKQPRKEKVLIICRYDYIIDSTKKVLASLSMECHALLEEMEGLTNKILHFDYDLLLIVGSVEPHLADDLLDVSERNKPAAKVLIHLGGPATIPAEISEVFAKS